MPAHLTLPQLTALTALTLASLSWLTTLTRTLRRPRHPYAQPRPAPLRPDGLPALPAQRRTGPTAEATPLTPAEEHAFATLVRRLADDR
ncbi:MAG TPA: hypothetical protein VIU15_48030 [Streptomyces sp.]